MHKDCRILIPYICEDYKTRSICLYSWELLDEILAKPDLLPKSDLASAAGYLDMEWDAVVDIFKRGDTNLDNNLVERMNRYFSMSRRSSLFFGSHSGAERAAVLYTLALSAKTNHINLFAER